MANIFDIDVNIPDSKDTAAKITETDVHLLNEQFHVFSKSPSSAATSLGSASNRSGHTVTATDVWAEEIPAFYEVPDMNSTASLNPNENDLCRVGNSVAIYKNGAWSLEYASYMDIPDGHEFLNASGKPVIRFHKNRLARLLTVKNNAADDGLSSSAKIQGWDKTANNGQGAPYEYVEAAPKFVSQFVTSTDKIVDGKPSKGYGPFVMANTTAGDITKVLNEGTVDDNDYVANSFAGIIQYNKKRTDAIYVHAFEYCGKKLDVTVSELAAAVFGENNDPENNDASLTQKVAQNTAAIAKLNGSSTEAGSVAKAVADAEGRIAVTTNALQSAIDTLNGTESTTGSVAKAVADVKSEITGITDGLAGRIAQLEGISHFTVEIVDTLPTAPVENTIYLVAEEGVAEGTYIEYIAYKPAGSETVVTEKIGSTALDLSGYTTDEEHTALADRVTALDGETGRVTVVEGKVSTLEGQVSTLTTETIPAIQQSVTDARTYAEQQASAAQTAATTAASQALATARGEITTEIATAKSGAESTAATALSAAVEQIGKDIEAAKNEAISSAEVTINAGTGIVVTPEGKGTTFEISVSDAVATAADLTALTGRVTTLETTTVPGIDTRLQAAEATITALTSGDASVDSKIAAAVESLEGEISGAVESLEGQITETQNTLRGEIDGVAQDLSLVKADIATGATANAIKTAQETADAKVASVTVASAPNGVSFSTGTTPALTITTANWQKDVDGYSFLGSGDRLITGDTALSVAQNVAENVADDVKSQSLAQTGTWTGMFSVAIDGSVGSGITSITITDNGITQAIADAKSGAEQTAATALSTARSEITTEISTAVSALETKLTSGEGSLSSKIAALETATGTTLPAAIEQALEDAKAYSDSLHTTSLDYVVLGDSESLPAASVDTLGKIYLVANQNAPAADGSAISGSYVEYMTRKVGEGETATYTWEKIGTTEADLSAYAKTADVTDAIATAKSEAIGAAKTETTTQVNALAATHAADKATLEGSISTINTTIAEMDADLTVNGISVKQVDGKVTELSESLITASVPANTTKVEGNIAYVGSTKHVIAPEKFQTATTMPATLTSWVADLSNLTDGSTMFSGCSNLTTFIGDLSSLENAGMMFSHCNLSVESLEFIADSLPEIVSDPVGLTKGMICLGNTTDAHAAAIAEIESKGWTIQEDIIVSPN